MDLSELFTLAEVNQNYLCLIRPAGQQESLVILPGEKPVAGVQSIENLSVESFFLFAPFRPDSHTPAILFPEPIICAVREVTRDHFRIPSPGSPILKEHNGIPETQYEDYADAFGQVMELFKSGKLEKLVLSRTKKINRPQQFSEARCYRSLCAEYKHAFVYAMFLPPETWWIGASPELLLSEKNGVLETVALAGTRKLNLPFTTKEFEEQDFVNRYQEALLDALGVNWTKSGPAEFEAGAIKHLKTTYSIDRRSVDIPDILAAMHPTPAVCGTPKHEARDAILHIEQHKREYYSGYLGFHQPGKQSLFFVNLRCTRIRAGELTLYSGGGLTPSSDLESEWNETEAKAETLLSVIKKM